MRTLLVLFMVVALSASAIGQQQTVEQRIGTQIGAMVIQNAALMDQVEKLQAQLDAAKKRIQDLEAASKTPPPPKP